MSLALVYVRQSDHKRYERTTSPEVQREACVALPAVNACDQVEIFEDLGVSGGKLKGRKGFDRLIKRIEAAEVAVVAAYDQSRAFRNTRDALDFYALMERRPEIEVEFVHGQFDRTPTGEFSYTTLAAAHRLELRMIGDKIRDAKQRAKRNGLPVGEVAAGYKWDSEGVDRKLIIDEPVAAIVHRVFAEYAQGRGATDIARRLNAERVWLPNMKGEWRWSQVNAVLRNVVYHGQTYTVDNDANGAKKGALIDAQWPAIIDDDLWAAVRARARKRYRAGHAGKRAYVFRGLLRCSCGARLHLTNPKPEYVYYFCRRDGSTDQDACTNRGYVREEELLPWARSVFAHVDRDPLRPGSQSGAGKDAASRRRRAQPDALASIDATIARLGKRFEWGHLDDVAYRAEWERLQALRAEILAADRAPMGDALAKELRGAVALWDGAERDPDMRRRMLLTLFEELDVRDGAIVGYRPREDRAARVHELLGDVNGLAVRFA